MKYHQGMIHTADFENNPIICVKCNSKVRLAKRREDKKLVCIACWNKDEERETPELDY